MAGACITPPCLVRPSTTTTLRLRKPLLLACALTTPRPRKHTKRKNYLRPKILKTSTKPQIEYTHILPSHELKAPENQELRLSDEGIVNDTESTFYETPLQQTHIFPSGLASGDELTTSENQELRFSEVSDPAGAVNAASGTFGKSSLLKFGLWVVGAFVFQTVCAVWVLGSADNSGKDRSLDGSGYKNEVLELDLKGKSKYKLSIENGGIVFVDEAEMEKKIEEIQHMAREAREKERLESKGSDVDEEREEEIEDSDVKMGIQKEVDERLIKVRKRLGKVSNKQPTNSVTYPTANVDKNDRDDGSNLDEKELSAALIFKRKQKFRDFASKPSNKPKGFMALDHQSVGTNGDKKLEGSTEVLKNANGEGGVDVSERTVKNVEGGKVDVIKAVKKNSLEKSGRKKKGIASDLEESEPGIDILVDRNNGSSLCEAVDTKESSIQETATISNTENTLVEVMHSRESRRVKCTTTMNRRKKSNSNGASNLKEIMDQKVVKPKEGYTHAERS